MSAAPVSLATAVLEAFAARSVAVADGINLMAALAAAVVVAPLGRPRVIVIVDPLRTIVDVWKFTVAVV